MFRLHGGRKKNVRRLVKSAIRVARKNYLTATFASRGSSIGIAFIKAMQSPVCKLPQESDSRIRCARSRRKVVSQVLKDAYRRHVRDRFTRLAVKQTLG